MKKSNLIKTIIGVLVIGAGIGYFMLEAMKSSISYYYSVDDYATNAEVIKNHSLRLAGIVKESSVVRDLEKVDLRFTLAGTNNEIPVSYKGSIPDNFVEEGEVVVEGRVDTNGIFQADILMTKCESKYKAKVKQ